ncbi:unnamed protein product [Bubo scandiacus]
MTFVDLLAHLGGMGRFQVTYVAALAIPLLMLASHNLLQNFTAGVPEHHCRPRWPVANGQHRGCPAPCLHPLRRPPPAPALPTLRGTPVAPLGGQWYSQWHGAAGVGAAGGAAAGGGPGRAGPHPRDEDGLLRRLLRLVLHQLRLLWAGHGPAGLRGEHLPEPAGLRGRGHPGQAGLGAGHQLRGPASGPRGLLGARRICILANIVVPTELRLLRMALAVLGKGSLAASFNCAYIFTGELFPTLIRQTGMGLGGTMARVGGMVAPLVRMLAEVAPPLPLLIYGAAPIISAVATCFLPETRDVPLPETVGDVERRGRHLKDEEVTVPLGTTKAKDGV